MTEIHATDNGAVADSDAGGIDEVPNWYFDREEWGVIPPPLLPSSMMDDCEDSNDKDDDGDI